MRIKTLLAIAATTLTACHNHTHEASIIPPCEVDIDSIKSRGTIRVAIDYNTVNYFVYKGIPVGYQYEIINEYAKHTGLNTELIVSNDYEENVKSLNNGNVDIIATSLIADTINEHRIHFTEPYARSRMVLVQRNTKPSIDSLEQLAGDTLYLQDNSFYINTIEAINDTASFNEIKIEAIGHYDMEQIIEMVAEEEVKQTISLENIARANKWYFPNIDISTPITQEYDLAWGVRLTSTDLKTDIDNWLKEFKRTARFKQIYRKYIIDPREHHSNTQKTTADTYRNTYEDIIKKTSATSRFDWRLISSVVYQESHFNPEAKSWAGACGLMQLMPETASRFGVDDLTDPEQSITAGVKYLTWIDKRLVNYIADDDERTLFVLAAYNIGLGHIMDAIRLAEKQGMKPDKWHNNAEVALLLKANARYYSDPVVKHGYCRGTETINYVNNIIDRYENYKAILKDVKAKKKKK